MSRRKRWSCRWEEHDLQCQQCNSVLFHATTLVTGECVCLPCAPKRMVPKGSETLDWL